MTHQLEKADSKTFALWWAVYRNVNEDFSIGYEEQYRDIVNVPFCYWIVADGKRVGGIIMVNNRIGDFFLIPPCGDVNNLLTAILPKENRLLASSILTEHVSAFETLGFRMLESRRFMIRPTRDYRVELAYRRVVPQEDHADMMAELMYEAFRGSLGQYGQRDIAAHQASIEDYLSKIAAHALCHEASSLLFEDDKLIALCLVQPYNRHASIRFVVTHPEYRRCGIARQLMEYAIDHIKDVYPTIILAVTIGNPAEDLYHKMGFVGAPATHTLAYEKHRRKDKNP